MNSERITAQVAVEAIVNSPTAYDPETVVAVAEQAHRAGVARFYLDLLDQAAEGVIL